MTYRAAALALLLAGSACARPGAPPGGEPDATPPRVVEVVPAPFDTLSDLDARAVIRFDERISERLEGVPRIEDAVLVSPATSPVQARRRSRSIEVGLVEGWEPDLVYRVVIRPVYRDLFGNARLEPVELVFTTGADIPVSALAGFATDRLTGRPVANARIEAIRGEDQRTYVAMTDTAGFFAMRYTPDGAYRVRGWLDQDRDRLMDFFEVQDSVPTELEPGDTAVVELALLPSDTTPARLARATAVDSARVRLLLDDYFAPGMVQGEARLYLLPDTTFLGRGELLHGTVLDSILAAEEAEREGPAAGDVEARDTAEAEVETVTGQEPEPPPPGDPAGPGERGRAGVAGPRLPSQELLFLPDARLEQDSTYLVVVEGLTNIQGVPGGGGAASFQGPEPPPPDTAAQDTLAPDTLAPAPDTVGVPPDTVPPPSGTLGAGRKEAPSSRPRTGAAAAYARPAGAHR